MRGYPVGRFTSVAKDLKLGLWRINPASEWSGHFNCLATLFPTGHCLSAGNNSTASFFIG